MFWSRKHVAPARQRELLEALMRQTHAGLAGAYDKAKERLQYRHCEIDLTRPGTRRELLEELKKGFLALSRNPDNWALELGRLDNEIDVALAAGNHHQVAALVVLACLIRISICCKGALLYTDDTQLNAAVFNSTMANFGALDDILLGSESMNRSVSLELYSEMIYVKQFMDAKIGF